MRCADGCQAGRLILVVVPHGAFCADWRRCW
jgi:hypothetical protein